MRRLPTFTHCLQISDTLEIARRLNVFAIQNVHIWIFGWNDWNAVRKITDSRNKK